MTESTTAQRQAVHEALTTFAHKPLGQAATDLLAALGYSSQKTADLGHTAEELLGNIEQFRPDLGNIDRSKLQAAHWNSCAFLFQLTNDEIPSLAIGQSPLGADKQITPSQIESFVFLAIELQGESWTRTQLAAITRGLNQRFPMPAIVLFRYADCLSVAVIDRRQHLHDASREVLDSRITVIKDVRLTQPHRAHIDILARLILQNLGNKCCPSNFRELYDGWIGTLSTQKLNETFYKELAWWYMWAVKEVDFPQGGGEKVEERNAIGVIRLLTRLIFVWFIKERGLVPQALFDRDVLRTLLKQAPDNAPDASNYYQAILQNLFFATLNTEMGEQRRWAKTGKGMKEDYLIGLVYRYSEAFVQPDTVLQDYFANIPFLNGGLFECLDEQLTEQDLARRPELRPLVVKEGSQWVLRVDGFSRRPEARAKVPNKLFFDGVADAELNTEFDTKGKRYPVCGLIDLLNRYKFTVDENTPLDEEVALDPELLGKVFENLLASYNPDTRTTARKQSGSFYTPREVVDYMVNEALIAYFARHLPQGEQREAELRQLLSHADIDHSFNTTEADALVAAIENLKVLDPACGSGAFPMGMLAKLVATLKKIDPHNRRWCEQNRAPLQQRLQWAKKTPDPLQRDTEIDEAEAALHKHSQDFANPAYADYTRKLYLIEKCIFGSDIQPIAVQIAKLRFFIALIVSQPIDRTKPNWGITPLPNLETKIVAANTLFGVPRQGIQMSLINDSMISEKESELREAHAAYFSARTRASKKRRKEKVQKLHEELVNLLQRDHFVTAQDAERMARWNPFDQNRSADFFDVEWMFGMPRASDSTEAVFDIVIGNPPYVRHEEIKELKPLLKDIYHYECYTGTADLFVYFYERSVKLLKPQGVLSFITSNKWYRAKYGENLRQFMATHTVLKNIIDFGDEGIFTAIAYPTIVIAVRREDEKMPLSDKEVIRVLNWNKIYQVEYFPAVFQKESFKMPQIELKKQGWQLEPPKEREILARIRLVGTPLSDYVNGRFYRGVLTGLNEAFVIDADTKQQLIAEDARSAEIIKPFLRGRDIKRWNIEFENQFLIKIESSENVLHPWSNKSLEDAEEIFFNHYPAIYKRFQKYRKAMIDRCDQGKYFWELRSCAYWNEFEQPKIFVPAIENNVKYAPDSESYYGNDKTNIIVTPEWRYVIAILNSSVSWWITQQEFSGKQGGYYEFKPMYVSKLPIPAATAAQKKVINLIIDSILKNKDQRFEQLLNGLVFELFFPQDLHAAKIYLFDACEQAGIDQLAGLQGKVLQAAAQTWVDTVFATGHPIYAMLFDLQALDVVRTIEGKA